MRSKPPAGVFRCGHSLRMSRAQFQHAAAAAAAAAVTASRQSSTISRMKGVLA
ncbi:hypothetical protein OHA61_04835 [Streptomyces sp. NBC_00885]|nr:hypothetical protein OHA61_04835 [Streptomyces sp. NBC_00885]